MTNRFFNSCPEQGKPVADTKDTLIVAISSDRGLCGAINSGVARYLKSLFRDEANAQKKLYLFGDKARTALERELGSKMVMGVTECNKKKPATFALVAAVADKILEQKSDKYEFLYNKFLSAISFKLETIPIPSFEILEETGNLNFHGFNWAGNKREILRDLYEFRFASTLYALNIDSSTAEQSSRMNAMENSSKNATEMIGILKIRYNKARQGRITTELIEIISGVTSME